MMPAKYILPFCAAMMLSGCATLESLWPFSDDEEEAALEGDRIKVMAARQEISADDSLSSVNVTIPNATTPDSWPQSGGNAGHYIPNIAVTLASVRESAEAGAGESWQSVIIPGPVSSQDTIFAMDGAGVISAHSLANITDIIWRMEIEDEEDAGIFGGGLAYDNGTLFATTSRGLALALNAQTGELLWERRLQVPLRAAPRITGDIVFINSVGSQLFALDAATGGLVWKHEGIAEAASLLGKSVPAANNSVVIDAYNSGEIYGLSRSNGEVLWTDSLLLPMRTRAADAFTGISGDPVLVDRFVYSGSVSGMLAANDTRTGLRVWEQQIAPVDTPWVSGDFLYVITQNDRLAALYRPDGRIKWISDISREEYDEEEIVPTLQGPFMLNGQLIVIDPLGAISIFQPLDGSLIDRRDFPEGILAPPAFIDGVMYAITRDSTLLQIR
jgi:outer membrane protein assembly factor BamB